MYRDLPLGDLRRPALPGQLVQALPVLLEGAVHGRTLPQLSRKGGNQFPQRRFVRVIHPGCDHLSLRVLRIGGRAESDLRHVDLFLLLHVVEQPRGLADHQRQYTGGLRIESAAVAYLGSIQQPAHITDHLRGGHARRLQNIQKAAEGLFRFTHEFSAPPTPDAAPLRPLSRPEPKAWAGYSPPPADGRRRRIAGQPDPPDRAAVPGS